MNTFPVQGFGVHQTGSIPIKDFRRIATRYDKLAANFLSAVALAATLVFWL